MDKTSATETVDLIPGQVKLKAMKIGINSFPGRRSAKHEYS